MKFLYSLLFVVLFVSSCTKESGRQNGKQTIANVSYGNSPEQQMDIYLPAGRSTGSTKLLVLIHGGTWHSGSRTDLNEYIPLLQQRLPHYVLANISYRLATGTHLFPTQENDVRAALNFLAGKSAEYAFNRDRMAILGVSAGGHLALLQAYKHHSEVPVKAVVDFFGPTDLVDLYNNPINPLTASVLQSVTGTTPAENRQFYEQSSPLYFINPQVPPTLVLHGSQDSLVPLRQSQALIGAAEGAGIANRLIVYEGEGHGWSGEKLNNSVDQTAAFLEQYVR